MVKRVGVVRGGPGKYYALSIKRGGDILAHVNENLGDKYKAYDIFVDKDHIWHFAGVPIRPGDLTQKIDLCWNTSHPSLTHILEGLAIPTLSSSSFLAMLASNHDQLRSHLKGIGLEMPRRMILPLYQEDFDGPREKYALKKAKEVFEKFGSPWIVKSFTEDASMGVHLAKTFPELVQGIADGLAHDTSILVEEFVAGKAAAVHLVPGFRNEEQYTFPIDSPLLHPEEKHKLGNLAKALHAHIAGRHYLKTDVVLDSHGRTYILGMEEVPDLSEASHFAEACGRVGAKTHNVVEHMLEWAHS